MTSLGEPLNKQAEEGGIQKSLSICDLSKVVDQVREDLEKNNTKAVGRLCLAAMKHASSGITHPYIKIGELWKEMRKDKTGAPTMFNKATGVVKDGFSWMRINYIKTILMFLGLGGTIFKGKTIGLYMKAAASEYIDWSASEATTRPERFAGFCVLMVIRLFVSTVVPPTSPAFGVIIQAATPEDEKWTAMPFFLLASTVAGAVPWILDKFLQCVLRKGDFQYTFFAKRCIDAWPLTCWTGPAMMKVFENTGKNSSAAAFAVIFAHAAPFMGAQTTNMQRYYLPHPLDTIISQPFGMSEDLISMALAEAVRDTLLGSISLTVIICSLNFYEALSFGLLECMFNESGFSHYCKGKGLLCLVLNLMVGGCASTYLANTPQFNGTHIGLALVAGQLAIQVFICPAITFCWPDSCCLNYDKKGFSSYADKEGNEGSQPA